MLSYDLLGPMTDYETCKLSASTNNLSSQPGRNSSPEDIPLLFIADTSVEDKEFHLDMTTDFSVNLMGSKTNNTLTPNQGNNKVDSNKSKNESLASDGFKKLCVKLNPNSHVAESQITSESTLLCEENESML
ncbi:hypothetical protein Avbf_07025 [Armadillidium vulgare]|nr:hypothetical protein Avbf_07025 [Armadillidium vulgare]